LQPSSKVGRDTTTRKGTMSQPTTTATWQRCDCCNEFVCTVHDQHASECDCPEIDQWDAAGLSPYLPDQDAAAIAALLS